ncbi:MAG: hypothetical protein QXR30_02985 [Candidatus Woesearchaeota archaeon]
MENIFKVKNLEDLDNFLFKHENHSHRIYEDDDFYYYISDFDYHIRSKHDSLKEKTISRDYFYLLFKSLRNELKLEIKNYDFFSKDYNVPIATSKKVKDRIFIFYREPLNIFVEDNDYMRSIYETLKKRIYSRRKDNVFNSINNEIFLTKETYNSLDDITLHELHFLKNLRDVVNDILVYDIQEETYILTQHILKEIENLQTFDDLFEYISNFNKKKVTVRLDQYLRKGKGICKQFALLYGYLLESLIDDFLLGGNFSLDLYFVKDNKNNFKFGHIWARYESLENKVFILDQKYILELFSNAELQANQYYKKPSEFEKYIQRKIKIKSYSL